MKSKKLIALALTAALAVSSVGMTAFAEGYFPFTTAPGFASYTDENDVTAYKIVFPYKYTGADGTEQGSGDYVVMDSTKDLVPGISGQYRTFSDEDRVQLQNTGYSFAVSALHLPDQEKQGYKFTGWSKSLDGTKVDTLTDEDYVPGGLTLYPVFEEITAEDLLEEAKELAEEAQSIAESAETEDELDTARDKKNDAVAKIAEAQAKESNVDITKANEAVTAAAAAINTKEQELNSGSDDNSDTDDSDDNSNTDDTEYVATKDGDNLTADELKEQIHVDSKDTKTDDEAAAALEGSKADEANAAVYNIYLTEGVSLLDGKEATVSVTIAKAAGKKVTIYHMKDDNTVKETLTANADKDGKIEFKVNSFSYFVFSWPADSSDAGTGSTSASTGSSSSSSSGSSSSGTSTNSPHTGDFSAVPIVLIAVAALGATGGAVVYRKRKAMAE